MLIAALMSGTGVIVRAASTVRDSAGSLKPGEPQRITVERCAVMSPYGATVGSSSEINDASETVITRRVFAAPLGTTILPADRIEWGGRTWEVIGDPLEFPLTSLARVEVPVKEVRG